MKCKLALEDTGRVAFLNKRKHMHDCVDARHANKPCSCSSLVSPPQQQDPIKDKLVEFLGSCCLLCVCCPIGSLGCFIKLPCRICRRVMRRARHWACCGQKNRMVAEYSSLSDIDSDITYGKIKPSSVSEARRDRFHSLPSK